MVTMGPEEEEEEEEEVTKRVTSSVYGNTVVSIVLRNVRFSSFCLAFLSEGNK